MHHIAPFEQRGPEHELYCALHIAVIPLTIAFISDTPRITGDSVYVNFVLSKVAETVSTQIRNVNTGRTVEKECKLSMRCYICSVFRIKLCCPCFNR